MRFQTFATYENIGYKFGAWHSVGWWKLQINNYDLQPPPPLKLSELDSQNLHDLFSRTAQTISLKLTGQTTGFRFHPLHFLFLYAGCSGCHLNYRPLHCYHPICILFQYIL